MSVLRDIRGGSPGMPGTDRVNGTDTGRCLTMSDKSIAGVSREEASEHLDEIRGSDKRLTFEDGIGEGWIRHEGGDDWLVHMSFGRPATFSEDYLLDEMESEDIEMGGVEDGEW